MRKRLTIFLLLLALFVSLVPTPGEAQSLNDLWRESFQSCSGVPCLNVKNAVATGAWTGSSNLNDLMFSSFQSCAGVPCLGVTLDSSSTIPAPGSNTQVLFNDSGVIGADAGFTYVKATDTATLGALVLTTPLPATSGGTGLASYAVGDLLYASTTTVLAKRAAVATGQLLASAGVGTAPVWLSQPTLTAGGGTQTYKMGGTLYWEYTNTANAGDTLYISSTPYALPAATLATNGDRLDFYVTAVYDATAATKTVICNIGYSSFDTTTGFTGGLSFISNATTTISVSTVFKAEVTRLGAASDLHNFWAVTGTSNQVSGVAAGTAVTWANANNILCIAKSSVGTGGIVTLKDMRVTWNPR